MSELGATTQKPAFYNAVPGLTASQWAVVHFLYDEGSGVVRVFGPFATEAEARASRWAADSSSYKSDLGWPAFRYTTSFAIVRMGGEPGGEG
ncbi:MAG: hypothetical protein LC798_13070 [Chloroflexi bacterium]|nr:hypothetical protein [Chloroflexota bacterium]